MLYPVPMGAEQFETIGLVEPPFAAAPDPRFYFPSLSQRKAMSAVSYALNRGSGLVTVTGAEGLGKTLLLSHIANQIAGQPVTLARLAGGPGPLASEVAEAFGLARPQEASHALPAIEAFLLEETRRGQRALLLLDAGELLTDDAAQDLAALAGLHYGERSLLQIILAGDDSFAARLGDDAHWLGVRGRTVAMHALEPLLPDEIDPYLRHRLSRAGWQGSPALDTGLAPRLFEATQGVPAAINEAMRAHLQGLDQEEAGVIALEMVASPGPHAENQSPGPRSAQAEPMQENAMPDAALAEAQIEAIETAFAEHDRKLGKLRRDLAELRERSQTPAASAPQPASELVERLAAIEERLDQHEQALRQVLERLITFFEERELG
jgi:general secretion pathway protein A